MKALFWGEGCIFQRQTDASHFYLTLIMVILMQISNYQWNFKIKRSKGMFGTIATCILFQYKLLSSNLFIIFFPRKKESIRKGIAKFLKCTHMVCGDTTITQASSTGACENP